MTLKASRKAAATKRRKRPKPVSTAEWLGLKSEAHDRRADTSELPAHAKIATIEIDDPLASGGEKERIIAARSIAHDPLAWLHAHRRIDDAQFQAGRRWQALYERAVLGAVQSVDTTKEPVDGGRWADVLTDNQALALRELRRLAQALGMVKAKLVEDVLGHGLTVRQAARMRGAMTDWAWRAWSRMLHEALNELAAELGLATKVVQLH